MKCSSRKTLATAFTLAAFAAFGAENAEPENELAADEHEPPWAFEAGFDNDFATAYVWRNSVINDRPVWQPCAWADVSHDATGLSAGFFVWQNWDLTNRRQAEIPRAMNETDYNLHLGYTAWQSEDEEWSLSFEAGHEWYTYRARKDFRDDYPSSREIYVKAEFENPYVGVYGQYSHAYHPFDANHFELGLKKEVSLGDLAGVEESWLNDLTLGADWNLNFGSGMYLTEGLYGVGRDYDPTEEEFGDNLKDGIGGTTIRFDLSYEVCKHFTVGAFVAYTAVLNGDVRDGMSAADYGRASRNLVWGGFKAGLEF